MIDVRNHPLAEAARYNDAAAEEHDFKQVFTDMGIEFDVVQHVAEQRAMRVAILVSRGEEAMRKISKATVPTPLALSMAEKQIMATMIPAYYDGILIGWKGHSLKRAGVS